MLRWQYLLPLWLLALSFKQAAPAAHDPGIRFRFRNQAHILLAPMRPDKMADGVRTRTRTTAQLDTLSNCYHLEEQYVEIVRQDRPTNPQLGLALGFEFDESNGDYPYTPAHAVLQLKNFSWGGVEFAANDTLNYTGISNAISDDFDIQVDYYRNDTIAGHFSGLLLNGAGGVAGLEEGRFAVRVYRVR